MSKTKPTSTIIKLSDVGLTKNDKTLLKDINWEVNKGEHWALIGRNGSGKSLTLNIICGYLWPSTGKVEVLNQIYGQTNLRELRKKIGWVSTALEYKLEEKKLSAEDVVFSGIFASIGLYDEPTSEDVNFAYKQMDFMDCLHLSKRDFSGLSTGEKKRVIIARALSAKPKLLILDEPANGLDLTSREEFLNSIEKLSKTEATIIYVTHHIEEISGFINNCILFKNGKILSKGKKESILNNKELSICLDMKIELEKKGKRYSTKVT